ncbi:sodium- and chloride-dependent transporter XTRP3-like [Aphis craccivora]|uniref:Sodium-and chloride-dependent transporter XTRP3-like n=1 Tax=Aphis craccivora TaxID=307492 RepID=A0A6G0YIW6_APHCR|nr:sodium- and chloride-dependent transporter XTRP3-like [Aphis craccivora]
MNYERETRTQIHSKIGKIPSRLITIDTLHADLQKLSEILRKDGFEPVIKINKLSLYYNIQITECQFSKTQVLIKLKIPIREYKSDWKLFQYVPAHFKYKNTTCIINSEKTYMAVNTINNKHRIISGIGLQYCDPPLTDLCYTHRFSSDLTLTPKCVESIFKNLPLEEINKYCYFQCVTQTNNEETIIKQIGVNTTQ